MNKILIVDDIPQNLYMLEVLLQTHGYDVTKASNGIEALDLARKDPPDLVISDILMPGMDGFSLCRTWKLDNQLKHIPLIVYTATYTDLKDEKFALSLGADRFLVKPLEPDAFLAILQEVIQNHETRQAIPRKDSIDTQEEFFKEYNQTLIRKLEDKMMQLQISNNRLISLYQASCDLQKMKPSSELIQIILQSLIKAAGHQYACYFCLDDKQRNLSLLVATGFPEKPFEQIKAKLLLHLGEPPGFVNQVAHDLQTINIEDVSRDSKWKNPDTTIQSAYFVPVHHDKAVFGVLGIFSKVKNAFSKEDEQDIIALSNNMAVAIGNIKSQEQLKKQLNRISALHKIDTAVNRSTDLNIILRIFLDQVMEQLHTDAVDVLLLSPDAINFEYAMGKGFSTGKIEDDLLRIGRSLDKKVASERRILHMTQLTNNMVSPDFLTMFEKEGFQTYVGAPLLAKGKILGVLEIFMRSHFNPDMEWMDFLNTLSGQASLAVNNMQMFNELGRSQLELFVAYDATISSWSRAVELRNHETVGHTQRVTEWTVQLSEIVGIKKEQLVQIRRGALLHDIGEFGVPESILLKTGKLTDEEWITMRKHPQLAYDMLISIDYLKSALDIPYCHHEKWDGTGYPQALLGEQIPISARVFAIVDVWDALLSDRPYRHAWSRSKVMEYIRDQSGKHFDPSLVEKFIRLIEKVKR